MITKETVNTTSPDKKYKYDTSKKITEQKAEQQNWIAKIGMGAGKVVATFNQSAGSSRYDESDSDPFYGFRFPFDWCDTRFWDR